MREGEGGGKGERELKGNHSGNGKKTNPFEINKRCSDIAIINLIINWYQSTRSELSLEKRNEGRRWRRRRGAQGTNVGTVHEKPLIDLQYIT